MEKISIIVGVCSVWLNLIMLYYIANKTGSVAGMYDNVKQHSKAIQNYVYKHKEQILLDRKETNKLYGEVRVYHAEIQTKYSKIKKIADETTQKTSGCSYKYEYTNSTV